MAEVISSKDIDMPEMPDPQKIPDTPITTAAAFGGAAPIQKDPEEMVEKRAEGKLPVQESETAMIADNVSLNPGQAIPGGN